MLATKYRVPRQYIDYILKKGDSFTSKLFIIRCKKNKQNFCRYRTIISRKVDLKAVKRNRLRRQIYEAIRVNQKNDLTKHESKNSHLDLVLIAKKSTLKAPFAEIEIDIQNNIIHGKI